MKRSANATTLLLVCDQQRSVLQRYANPCREPRAYSPYGHHPWRSGALAFNGELPEAISGHYLLGHGYRAYNPTLMRFNRPDSWSPFGRGGLNAYAYCLGDPLNRRDPTGHFPVATLIALVGMGAGFLTKGTSLSMSVVGLVAGAASMAVDMQLAESSKEEHSAQWQLPLILGSIVISTSLVGGLLSKADDIIQLSRKALTRRGSVGELPPGRAVIEAQLSGIPQPSSFTKLLTGTNLNLGSHGDDALSVAHANRYVDIARKVESGSLSNTSAHLQSTVEWSKAQGPSRVVGMAFNSVATVISGGLDAAQRKTGLAIRRSSF